MGRLVVMSFLGEGPLPYPPVWEFQKSLWAKRAAGEIPDTLLLLEHERVITLGRGARREHLLASPVFLKERGFDVVEVERGGDVTYHGPGQLIAYPIFQIPERLAGVRGFVHNLEEVMIRILASRGIQAHRDPKNRGVFLGRDKIGAVGVAVRRWVSFHGFALYVSPPLEDFQWIVPCGLVDYGITSMERVLGMPITPAELEEEAIRAFVEVYGFDAWERQRPPHWEWSYAEWKQDAELPK